MNWPVVSSAWRKRPLKEDSPRKLYGVDRQEGHPGCKKTCSNTKMAGRSRVSGAVGADPGPSTGDYGHNRGADPGPLLSYEQGIELRIGSVNVGTLRGRCGEVVDMVGRRKLDICCLQETRWKGGSSRNMGKDGARYKLFWVVVRMVGLAWGCWWQRNGWIVSLM